MIKSEREKLKYFIEYRNKYIDDLDNMLIDKQEFNNRNHQLVEKLRLKPYSQIKNFDQALYNYHYYNTKAKNSLYLANRYRDINNYKKAKQEDNAKINYYNEKDKATKAMILLEDKENIEAYYIKLHSKRLHNSIFEINFTNRNKSILHSKSESIKNILIENKCFSEDLKPSLIDSYVNTGS